VVVASVASDVVGWALIGLGILGVAGGIVAAVIVALLASVMRARSATIAVPESAWKEFFGLLKDLAKTPEGLAVILGLLSIAAGALVLHYRWF
jgi:hypothetical protein